MYLSLSLNLKAFIWSSGRQWTVNYTYPIMFNNQFAIVKILLQNYNCLEKPSSVGGFYPRSFLSLSLSLSPPHSLFYSVSPLMGAEHNIICTLWFRFRITCSIHNILPTFATCLLTVDIACIYIYTNTPIDVMWVIFFIIIIISTSNKYPLMDTVVIIVVIVWNTIILYYIIPYGV